MVRKLDKVFCQIHNFYRLAHIKNKYLTALGKTARLTNKLSSFGDSHKVACNIRVSYAYRTACLNLLFENRNNRAMRAKHISETNCSIHSCIAYLVHILDNHFSNPLGTAHNISRVNCFVC